MIKTKEEVRQVTEENAKGEVKLYLSQLGEFPGVGEKIRMYAHARLKPGEEVEFHVHTNESEIYYVISGKALYDDNGTKIELEAGAVTHTPPGSGHGIANIGDDMLEFMALEIKN